MWLRLIWVLGALLYSQWAGAAGILVLGDSISAAYGIDKRAGWVELLATRVENCCAGIEVHNGSVSGETTAGALFRLPQLLQQHRPDLVIVELGGNDGLRGLSPAQMASNLRRMIDLVREAGATPVLLGMLLPPNYGVAYQHAFAQSFEQVARDRDVAFVKFFLDGVGERPEWMQGDGLHPTAEAQPRLLDNAWVALEKPVNGLCVARSAGVK